MTISTSWLKLTADLQLGKITSIELKLTNWANSNKSTWWKFIMACEELAVSTTSGFLYRGELLQRVSILLRSIVDLLGKEMTADDFSYFTLADVILCILGGLGLFTTQSSDKLRSSHLITWCSIF